MKEIAYSIDNKYRLVKNYDRYEIEHKIKEKWEVVYKGYVIEKILKIFENSS